MNKIKKIFIGSIYAILLLIIACCYLMICIYTYEINGKAEIEDNKEKEVVEKIFYELETNIDNYLNEKNIPLNEISIVIQDLVNNDEYRLNDSENFFAASLYKLPLAMLMYESIDEGSSSLEDEYTYYNYYYEVGGPIGDTYHENDSIQLNEILYEMIVHSDNSAGHILFENLGGWIKFKEMSTKYSTQKVNSTFYNENIVTAAYMSDVCNYLYEHQEIFQELIEYLDESQPNDYLNRVVFRSVSQKHGYYENYYNAAGISLTSHPYSIVVLTNLGIDGIDVMADINKLCVEYFESYN